MTLRLHVRASVSANQVTGEQLVPLTHVADNLHYAVQISCRAFKEVVLALLFRVFLFVQTHT